MPISDAKDVELLTSGYWRCILVVNIFKQFIFSLFAISFEVLQTPGSIRHRKVEK